MWRHPLKKLPISPVRQAVKPPLLHSGNMGSTPVPGIWSYQPKLKLFERIIKNSDLGIQYENLRHTEWRM